jgi:hypothetical protein
MAEISRGATRASAVVKSSARWERIAADMGRPWRRKTRKYTGAALPSRLA